MPPQSQRWRARCSDGESVETCRFAPTHECEIFGDESVSDIQALFSPNSLSLCSATMKASNQPKRQVQTIDRVEVNLRSTQAYRQAVRRCYMKDLFHFVVVADKA